MPKIKLWIIGQCLINKCQNLYCICQEIKKNSYSFSLKSNCIWNYLYNFGIIIIIIWNFKNKFICQKFADFMESLYWWIFQIHKSRAFVHRSFFEGWCRCSCQPLHRAIIEREKRDFWACCFNILFSFKACKK